MDTSFEGKIWRQPSHIKYLLAALLALVSLLMRLLLTSSLGPTKVPFGFTIVSVALAAYVGGFGPGALAAVIGIVGSVFFFIPPRYSLQLESSQDVLQIITAVVVCVVISTVAGRLRQLARQNQALAGKLDQEPARFTDVFEGITLPVLTLDENWVVIQTNSAFEQLFRPHLPPMTGCKIWEIFPNREDTPVYQALRQAMKDRKPQHVDVPHPDNFRWYQVSAYPNSSGVSVFFYDITDRMAFEQGRKATLEDARAARGEAEIAARSKEDFLTTLSHELRTPMTSILGWAELLQRGNLTAEELTEGLVRIEKAAQVQAKMVDEILDLSRINAGKLQVEMEMLGLSEVAQEAVSIHTPAAVAKEIDLSFQDDMEGRLVRGDEARLHQILSNLLSNAIKFTPRGGSVFVRTFIEGSNACFSVEDTGEGICPKFLPHVFDRFRQADASASRKYDGLGLGLSIAKQLIELQGGTITVRSDGVGQGSAFTVCLPEVKRKESLSPSEIDHEPRANLAGVHVLLVEDDESTRLLLKRLIESH